MAKHNRVQYGYSRAEPGASRNRAATSSATVPQSAEAYGESKVETKTNACRRTRTQTKASTRCKRAKLGLAAASTLRDTITLQLPRESRDSNEFQLFHSEPKITKYSENV